MPSLKRTLVTLTMGGSAAAAWSLERIFKPAGGLASLRSPSGEPVEDSLEADCKEFVAYEDCRKEDWIGVLTDLFSPDDTCPESTRYIDLNTTDGALQVTSVL